MRNDTGSTADGGPASLGTGAAGVAVDHSPPAATWLAGGGAMAALLDGVDWSASPLGPPETWPQSLLSTLSICLNSRFPICLYWGREHALLYNEAWSPIPGSKHPWALGRPAREVWPELWETLGPRFARVLSGKETIFAEDELFVMTRHGFREDCYFDYALSPVRGEQGSIVGIFNVALETTSRMIAARRGELLRRLSEETLSAASEEAIPAVAGAVLASAERDVAFCLIYLIDPQSGLAELSGRVDENPWARSSPRQIALQADESGSRVWPLARVHQTGEPAVVHIPDGLGSLPCPSGEPESVQNALIVAIPGFGAPPECVGFLVLGASPHLSIDQDYRSFAGFAADTIGSAMLKIRAHSADRRIAVELLALKSFALNRVREAAYLIDENAHFLYVNSESCRMLGYSEDELLQLGVPDIGPEYPMDRWTQHWRELKGKGSLTFESTHLTKTGSILPVEITANYFEFQGRSYNLALVRDISERKASEHKLQLLTAALDAVSDAIFLMPETSQNFLYVNRSAAQALGYSREELCAGMRLEDIDPGWSPAAWDEMRRDLATQGRYSFEASHRTRSGRSFPVELTVNLFEFDGQTYHLLACRDISERKQAEDALRKSEIQFRNLVEGWPDEIARYDRDCRRIYINRTMEGTLGTPEMLLGRTPIESFPGSQPIVFYQDKLQEVLDTGRAISFEMGSDAPANQPKYRALWLGPEFDAAGRVSGVFAIARDITEQKKAEEMLATSERNYRALAENLPDQITRFDRDCRPLYINSAVARTFGVAPEEVYGKTLRQLAEGLHAGHPGADDRAPRAIREVFETGEPNTLELNWLTLRGEGVFEVRHVPEKDPQGRVVSVLGIAREVTQRRNAEDLLHKREQEFRALVENTPDVIARFDAEGRYLYLNPAAERIFGIGPDELIGQRFDSSWRDPRGEANAGASTLEAIRDAFASGQAAQLESRWNVAGHEQVFEVRLVPERDPAGLVVSVLGIFRDVSARKRSEASLQRLNLIYAALSECNKAIARHHSEEGLFPQVCRDAVLLGGMKMAWIGLVDPGTTMVRVAASFGAGVAYLDGIEISVDRSHPRGRGPTGTAIRENRPFWCQDFQTDPALIPWRELGARYGWRASASLPIHRRGVPVGALMLYADQVQAFDAASRHLLEEMAQNISSALDHFAAERAQHELQQHIVQTKAQMDNILGNIDQVVWSLDAQTGQLLYLNEAAEAVFGRSAAEFMADERLITEAIHPDDATRLFDLEKRIQTSGAGELEFRIRRPDGTERWVLCRAWLARDHAGEVARLDGVLSDITERRREQAQMELSAKVFGQSAEGIIICGADRTILEVNRAFCEISGFEPADLIGRNPDFLQSGHHDRDFFRQLWEEVETSGRWQGEVWSRRKSGDVYPEFVSISAVKDEAGQVTNYIEISNDLTQHKHLEEHVRQLAHFDALTGLPNRATLNDRVEQAIALAQRGKHQMALMFLDLDRFKNINDSLGHRIGDAILVQTARRLENVVRQEDTVSRIGGDEFILLLPHADAEGAAHVAQKIVEAIATPFEVDIHELTVTSSLGIAMYPADGSTVEALMQCADSAMYRAKDSGRNTYRFFTPEMHVQAHRALRLENAIRRALARREMSLHYQPQIDVQSGQVIGCEALLRWKHPELGMIPPAVFIPIAEDSGQILPIGEWVLRTAVRQIKAWAEEGLGYMTMAVNLSVVQFRQANLTELVIEVLEENDVDPRYLELELTETITMEHPEVAIGIMNRLHQRGIRLAIDDFGTGYSSLSYLKRFNIDKLKIDQSFVREIIANPDDAVIVNAIIGLARSLNLRTIAEGVETAEQLARLQSWGCNAYQGFLFSEALSAADFKKLLLKDRIAGAPD